MPSKNDNVTRIILSLLLMGVGILAAVVFSAAGALWLLGKVGVDEAAVRLPVLLILSVMGLLFAITVLLAAFKSFDLADRTKALGLPEGSVRAMIALMLILLFAIAGLYIFGSLGNDPDVGKQLVTTLSTLVVAVAAFYFGVKAVEAGIAAAQAPPAAGAVTLNPSEVSFGKVSRGGESPPKDFTLTNRTAAAIEVTDVILKGAAGFEVESVKEPPDPTKRWWPGTKIELQPGDELSIRTKLKWQDKSTEGDAKATLNVLHTGLGAAPTASLEGKFVAPAAAPAVGVTPTTVPPARKTPPETEVAVPDTEVGAPETEEATSSEEEVPPSEAEVPPSEEEK